MSDKDYTVADALESLVFGAGSKLDAALRWIGVDPDMTVNQLRADLAIAQRAREPYTLPEDQFDPLWIIGHEAAVRNILGGDA